MNEAEILKLIRELTEAILDGHTVVVQIADNGEYGRWATVRCKAIDFDFSEYGDDTLAWQFVYIADNLSRMKPIKDAIVGQSQKDGT